MKSNQSATSDSPLIVGVGASAGGLDAFQESGFGYSDVRTSASVQLIAFGSYLEMSVNGRVVLSLADQSFESGQLGIYVETAAVRVSQMRLDRLDCPRQSDEHLASG